MNDDVQPDLDRFVAPFRRHWAAMLVAVAALTVVFGVGVAQLLDTGRFETRFTATVESRPTSLELNAVLPTSANILIQPPAVGDIATFFSQPDLDEDLGLAHEVDVLVEEPLTNPLIVHVAAGSREQTAAAVDTLVAGYEAKRLSDLVEARDEAEQGIVRSLDVTDQELAALADIPSALEQRSALARGRVALLTAQELLADFPDDSSVGVEFDVVDPIEAVPSSTIAAAGLGLTAAIAVVVGVGLLWALVDTRVRSRSDLARALPGVDVVGLVDDGVEAGALAVARGIMARDVEGEVQLVATAAPVADLAAAIERELVDGGSATRVTHFDSPDELPAALRGAARAAATLVVVDWGRTTRAAARLSATQLGFAGARELGIVFRGVPRRELDATLR